MLDFVIFGVPRSGTKGLANALNDHPQIYCAPERFEPEDDHSRIVFPESFTRLPLFSRAAVRRKVAGIRTAIEDKRDIRLIGNRQPRYYLTLERINRDMPDVKNVWIYRSPTGFMQSWNRRAIRQNSNWHPGQIGIFGLVELFICLERCLSLPKDILIFPYDHGLNRSPEPMRHTLEFLGADVSAFDFLQFERSHLAKLRTSDKRIPLRADEVELIDKLRIGALDAILEGKKVQFVSNVAAEVKDYLAFAIPRLPNLIENAFAASRTKHTSAYKAKLLRRVGSEHARLLLRPMSF